ncbi:hypothetical protein R1flu_015371 [Riccia fluitans]|uniref:Uncharacterized protein n=1 Tax=Riccia fluitans TaxID=41844 RepID=A0ABD1YJL3_9MARC
MGPLETEGASVLVRREIGAQKEDEEDGTGKGRDKEEIVGSILDERSVHREENNLRLSDNSSSTRIPPERNSHKCVASTLRALLMFTGQLLSCIDPLVGAGAVSQILDSLRADF